MIDQEKVNSAVEVANLWRWVVSLTLAPPSQQPDEFSWHQTGFCLMEIVRSCLRKNEEVEAEQSSLDNTSCMRFANWIYLKEISDLSSGVGILRSADQLKTRYFSINLEVALFANWKSTKWDASHIAKKKSFLHSHEVVFRKSIFAKLQRQCFSVLLTYLEYPLMCCELSFSLRPWPTQANSMHGLNEPSPPDVMDPRSWWASDEKDDDAAKLNASFGNVHFTKKQTMAPFWSSVVRQTTALIPGDKPSHYAIIIISNV